MNATWTTLLTRWGMPALAGLAGLAVVCGGFDVRGGAIWLGVLAAVGLTTGIIFDARWRFEGGTPPDRPWAASEGPLLWIVAAWALTRLAGGYGSYLIVAPAALVALLVAMFPAPVRLRALALAGGLELGLLLTRRISVVELGVRVAIIAGATWGLARLSRWSAWQADVAQARDDRAKAASNRAARRDFGLLTEQAPAITALPGLEIGERPTVGQRALDHVEEAFQLQADLLHAALGARTVAVLWRADPDQLRLRTWSGTIAADRIGPWSTAVGVPASVMREGTAVAVAPVHPGGLPYHPADAEIAAALAVPVLDAGAVAGVLCVDGDAPFEGPRRAAVEQAARALGLAVDMSRELKATDQERTIVQRICAALQALNGSLGLDAAVQATLEAVQVLVKPDLAALSVVRGDVHVVLGAVGDGAEALENLEFTGDEGLVGQAIAHGRVMPMHPGHRRGKGVFTAADTLESLQSLLVLPLSRADGNPVGALTVGARAADRFTGPRRDMLELIADQLGVKLDLAQAHDRLRGLATIDGLTGLSNHRTFQQAFDKMIARARRRKSPLCLLIVDIDHFKALNDGHGHPFGDEVLRAVAQVIGQAGRAVDLAARYGGEEFAVILEDSDADGGRRVAERIRAEIEGLRFGGESETVGASSDAPAAAADEAGPRGVRVTASVGLASLPDDATSKAILIELADKALYAAKRRGRNQVCAWADGVSG